MFLDNVVTQVIAAEGNGVWREYVGGYSDWERQRPATQAAPSKAAAKAADKNEVKAESTMAAPAAAHRPRRS
jgi:ATP-binding cassette subfamily F protein uup